MLPMYRHVSSRSSRFIAASLICSAAALSACGDNSVTTSPTRVPQVVAGGNASQSVTVGGTSQTITAHVTDQFGFSIPGTTVNFTANNGAVLSKASGVSDANGLVTTTVSVGTTTSVDTVTATIASSTTPAYFVVTVAPSAPATIAVTAGNNQSAAAGSTLPVQLTVQVKDQYGNLIPGQAVDWSATGGALAFPQTTTSDTGFARNTLILPATKGNVSVTAATHGAPVISTVFTETGT